MVRPLPQMPCVLALSAEHVACVGTSHLCAGAHTCAHPCVCLVQSSPTLNAISVLGLSLTWALPEEGRCGTCLQSAEARLCAGAPAAPTLLSVEAGLFVCLPLLLRTLPLLPAQAWAVEVPVGIGASLALAAAFGGPGSPTGLLFSLSARAETGSAIPRWPESACPWLLAGLLGQGGPCVHRAPLGVRISGTT